MSYPLSIKLVKPQIVISDAANPLGLWSSESRTITISRNLIEVLKHEMAHQIVSEIFHYTELHGAQFRRACDLLAVSEWARTATGKLPDSVPSWRDKQLCEEDERLLKRAEKLLALAESANEHEASLAMRRVRELYAKFNIENIRSNRTPDLVWTTLTRKKKKTDIIDSMILSILNKHFFVRVIHTNLFNASDGKEYKAAEVMGTSQNVLMAEYVFHFLRSKIESLTKEYRKTSGANAVKGRSYALGLLSGFQQKLDQEVTTKPGSEDFALMNTCDYQVNQY